MLDFNGLAAGSTMKEKKEDIFCYQVLKKQNIEYPVNHM